MKNEKNDEFWTLVEAIESFFHLPSFFFMRQIFPFCQHPDAFLIQELKNKVQSSLSPSPVLLQEYLSGDWSFVTIVFEDLALIHKPRLTYWDLYDQCIDDFENTVEECYLYIPNSSSENEFWSLGSFEFHLSLWSQKFGNKKRL